MTVLFCSPYIKSPEYAQGGLVVWGANMVNYHKEEGYRDVDLIPISFDRKTYAEKHNGKLDQIVNGVKELKSAVAKAISIIKHKEVDAVHVCTSTHFSLLKDWLILRVARKNGVKGFVHFHCGRVPLILKNGGWELFLFNRVMKFATTAITMDMASYNALQSAGYHNVANLPNPLSLDIINQIKNAGDVRRHPRRMVFVGHVVASKGIYELVESCLSVENPELRIIGKVLPEDKEKINAIANKKDNGKWLTWVGEIPHEEVIKELLAAELFVLPTYTEGFPNVILEAMACGNAIVTCAVGAIPEMLNILHDPCGIAVQPQSVKFYREALLSVIDSSDYLKRLSAKAVKRVNENYAMPIVWKQMIDIWTECNQ